MNSAADQTALRLYWILRVAVAMCFIGHGAFGIITKEVWCNYFAVFGIGRTLAYQLMPWVGFMDIACGLVMLFYPVRAIPVWLVVWGIVTALLRPLSGEPFAEFVERAGNYGAPLALLILSRNNRGLFTRLVPPAQPDAATGKQVFGFLQVAGFLLLAGHGWLNLIEKKSLLAQYASLGFPDPGAAAQWIGIAEILAAASLLFRVSRPVVLVFLLWKMTSELFYPHWEIFEWIERGGSYGVLAALWVAAKQQPARLFDGLFVSLKKLPT